MEKKITKAVITAAGLSTRMLPAAKSVTKVMFPIVDKPAIQYLAEEAAQSGITDILIIIGRGQECIENHFDYSPEYEYALKNKNSEESLKSLDIIRNISNLANIHYIRQKEPKGLGHAVLCAKSFVGNDDFIVMYGDDIIIGDSPATGELIDVYNRNGGNICVAGVKEVDREHLMKYCSLKVEPISANSNNNNNNNNNTSINSEFYVYDMNEKPKTETETFSNYAILGRVLLTPEIFDILEKQNPGANNEIQLTDSMKILVQSANGSAKMIAKVFSGERHDIGSKFGFLRANIIEGLKHPEIGEKLKEFLNEYVKTL